MNWKGDYYLGIPLEWDYNKVHSERNVKLSMPGYVKEALIEFNHESTTQHFFALPYREPVYGRRVRYVDMIDVPTFTKQQIYLLQRIYGFFVLCSSNRKYYDACTK